jgi:hypothetical protein
MAAPENQVWMVRCLLFSRSAQGGAEKSVVKCDVSAEEFFMDSVE